MTAKEKAKELYEKILYGFQHSIDEYTAKKCATLCVDEIIKNYDEKYKYCNTKVYWEEVKSEIEKL